MLRFALKILNEIGLEKHKPSALADAQISTEANIARTNENLTNFIAVVDRRFREDRNGK